MDGVPYELLMYRGKVVSVNIIYDIQACLKDDKFMKHVCLRALLK